MEIIKIPVGYLQTNCYILKENEKAIIIDPGAAAEKIEDNLKDLEVVGILLTHSHFDHIGALTYFENKYKLKHNDKIKDFNYEIIETKGHTKDSLTFYFKEDKVMFTGDFLFKGTIGRIDLEGGDINDMKESLKIIFTYPMNTTIYPGHGEESSLGAEKDNYLI